MTTFSERFRENCQQKEIDISDNDVSYMPENTFLTNTKLEMIHFRYALILLLSIK